MFSLSTQNFLELEEIKDDVIIIKNKGLRMVLMVSSLNFALKSGEEQTAIIYQFQNFLNSLDFSCQILVQSRKLNITGYLERLEELKEGKGKLLNVQIEEYKKFVSKTVKEGSIMQKTFFVIVPFSLSETRGGGISIKTAMTDERFNRAKSQLLQRARFVMLGLRECGLNSRPLDSLELAELFWSSYHPREAEQGFFPDFPPDLIK